MNYKIYQEIKRRIIFLEYAPGQALDEKKIAAEFKTSRTPIREVLQRLHWEKLLDIVPRGAITVSNLEFQQLKDLYFMRVHIEGLAGRLSTVYAQENHIKDMLDLKTAISKNKKNINPPYLVELDIQFREILYDATFNQILKEVSDSLYLQTIRMWVLFFSRHNKKGGLKNEIDHLIYEINGTIEMIREGDEKKGEEFRKDLMIRNIELAKKYFMKDIY
jgi:DNA-binding GntR family transcriptional regulator